MYKYGHGLSGLLEELARIITYGVQRWEMRGREALMAVESIWREWGHGVDKFVEQKLSLVTSSTLVSHQGTG